MYECTKHTARVKPSQYIAQHLYEQTSKSNCSSCSSHMSYQKHSKSPEKKKPSIEKSLVGRGNPAVRYHNYVKSATSNDYYQTEQTWAKRNELQLSRLHTLKTATTILCGIKSLKQRTSSLKRSVQSYASLPERLSNKNYDLLIIVQLFTAQLCPYD